MKRILAISLLLGLSLSLRAQDDQLSFQYYDCLDTALGAAEKLASCLEAEQVRQNARLDAAIGLLGAQLEAPQKETLTALQQLWSSFRDQNCRFHSSRSPGTEDRPGTSGPWCQLKMTAQRASELEDLLENPHAD